MLRPIGLTHGHYECRSFKDTVPVLTEILAFEKAGDENGSLGQPSTRACVHVARLPDACPGFPDLDFAD